MAIDPRRPDAWAKHGRIFIPSARPVRHGEMEYVRAYVTYSELFGTRPTPETFRGMLEGVGLRSLLISLSSLGCILHNDGVHSQRLQRLLRDSSFPPELLGRLRSLPNWNERVVFFPQQLLYTMKMALLYSPDRQDERPDTDFRHTMVEILLAASDLLDADFSTHLATDPERAATSFIVRNSLLNTSERIGYLIPRTSILVLKLPAEPEIRSSPDFLDLPGIFESAVGFTLLDYLCLCWAILTWFLKQSLLRDSYDEAHRALDTGTYFSHTTLPEPLRDRIFAAITHDYATLRKTLEARLASAPDRAPYDLLPFLTKPLYCVADTTILPLSLSSLEAKFTNGIYWTIHDHLSNSARMRFTRFFGQIFERYVRTLIQRAIPDSPVLARRVFPEFEYPTSTGPRRTPDVVLLYDDTALFIEVTASRIRLEETAISGDLAAFEQDLEKIIIRKATQLSDRIRDFRHNLYAFDDAFSTDIRRIQPVIVTIQSIPQSTLTWNLIRQGLQDRALLTQDNVEPLQILDVEELEILEGLLLDGVSLIQVLDARAADAERRNISMKNFLFSKWPSPPRNIYLQAEYQSIAAYATQLLFGIV